MPAISIGWLVIAAAACFGAPFLPLRDPQQIDVAATASLPTSGHWLGTDELGRDLLARLLFGGRTSLLVAGGATLVALIGGSAIGLVGGYFRGWSGNLAGGAFDVVLSLPTVVLVMVSTATYGTSLPVLCATIGLAGAPAFGRIAMVMTRSVAAARTIGSTRRSIVCREILPNVSSSLLVYALSYAALAVIIEGSLSYLGLSVADPAPSWGGLIAAGQVELEASPHIVLIPAAVIFLTVAALHAVGEAARRRYDIREISV